MEKKTVYGFTRNESEEIKISIGTYKDNDYVDVRVFYHDTASDEWRPTKKGVTFKRHLLPEMLEGLRRAEQELSVEASES